MDGLFNGIIFIGTNVVIIIWAVLKLISAIMISGLISTRLCHLSGYYWWFSSIILLSIILKILFYNSNTNILEKYNKNNEGL